MKFAELSDKAKERARETQRMSALSYDWWEYAYEDAKRIGALIGCEIDTRNEGRYTSPDIWFQGFYSQGDGAGWNGYLETSQLEGALARVKAEAPQDEELHRLAELAEQLHGGMTAVQVANRLCDDEDNREWPDVEIGMRIEVEGTERYYKTKIVTSLLPDDLEELCNDLVDGFAGWIFAQLRAEYDYRLSDVAIDEAIAANDPDFDEDGNSE